MQSIQYPLKFRLSAIFLVTLFAGAGLLPVETLARGAHVNRSVNVNRNVNVNTRRHVDVDVHRGYGHSYHPVATAAAVTATVAVTAAVVGSIVNTIPPSCSIVQVGNVAYQQCGSTWYRPQYYGSSVQYIVVNPPR